ncbi:Putative heterokaryon incompatibility [Septoria linicola]|uniref:Heterokaryon incompatibility n=1 Tax=Septoria linicola TaxID=215465 RepID=A0A9Q9EQ17_9PEZI|nr:Putative heterokaryon incompatibility [Septoria linicola]
MWLYDAVSRRHRQLHDHQAIDVGYVILSHTWAEDEPTFQNDKDGTARNRRGYQKVDQFCRKALQDGFRYVWVDTICIDKTSSAELSEAINSMFRWYKHAQRCYAYLSDVYTSIGRIESSLPQSFHPEIGRSKWFTRGWTLQELIAPSNLFFYSQEWALLGSKADLGLALEAASKVPLAVLQGSRVPSQYSIADRMSWAARRQTTRSEDEAYCLLGLFDVSVPMLYGEGGLKAFSHLQEAILKTSVDHSILLWNPLHPWDTWLVFAPSPAHFQHIPANASKKLGHVVRSASFDDEPFEITTLGVRIRLPVLRIRPSELHIVLNCRYENDRNGPIVLRVEHGTAPTDGGTWEAHIVRDSIRVSSGCFEVVPVTRLLSATSTKLLLRTPAIDQNVHSSIHEARIEVWLDGPCYSRLGPPLACLTGKWDGRQGIWYITSPWDSTKQDSTASIVWQYGSVYLQIIFRTIVPAGLRPHVLYKIVMSPEQEAYASEQGWTWLVDQQQPNDLIEVPRGNPQFWISHGLVQYGALPVYRFQVAHVAATRQVEVQVKMTAELPEMATGIIERPLLISKQLSVTRNNRAETDYEDTFVY